MSVEATTPVRTGHDADGSGIETWSFREIRHAYWRVAAVGLLATLVAYLGSFVVSPKYEATTRVLIRGRDTSVLNSTGANPPQQQAIVDSQLATALSDTQAALVANRHVGEQIVDKLHLDQPKKQKNGPIAVVKRAAANAYKHLRAYITSGFYKQPDRRETAIQTVAKGLDAKQVHDGFALDVTGSWSDAKTSAQIANAAGDILVKESNSRFRDEAAGFRDYLSKQVDQAVTTEQNARQAVADYKAKYGIVTTPEQDAQGGVQASDTLKAQISAAQAELDADQAQVSSLQSQLASTPQFTNTSQQITTGRSQTNIAASNVNPTYTAVLTQLQQGQANVAATSARLGALQGALATASSDPGTISSQEKGLNKLLLDVTIAGDTRARLAQQLEDASVNAQSPQVELTRVADAAPPTYPASPKRYLFLAVGLFVGALLGFVWSFLRVQRRERLAVWVDGNGASQRELGELEDVDLPTAERAERAERVERVARVARVGATAPVVTESDQPA